MAIKVNARPLAEKEWKALLEKEGFEIKNVFANPMRLLELRRIIENEGFFRMLKIGFDMLTHHAARKRILAMRSVFRKYSAHMIGIVIIAEKI